MTARTQVVIAACLVSVALVSILDERQVRIEDDEFTFGQRDILLEWTAQRAVLLGGADMTLSPGEFAETIGKPSFESTTVMASRTPGGYLVNAWVALLPDGWVMAAGLVVVGLALGGTILLAQRITGRTVPLPVIPLIALTLPVIGWTFHRSTDFVVTFSVLGCWYLAQRGDWRAGLALVPGLVLRLWPGIFIPYLWVRGRRKAAVVAAAGGVVVNLAGLTLPGVSVSPSLATIGGTVDAVGWEWNTSLPGTLLRNGMDASLVPAVTLVVVLAAYWVGRKMSFDRAFGLLLLAALVAAPAVWDHYRVTLFPLAIVHPAGLIVLAVELVPGLLILAMGRGAMGYGWYSTVSALAVLVVWLGVGGRVEVGTGPAEPEEPEVGEDLGGVCFVGESEMQVVLVTERDQARGGEDVP